MSPVKVVLVGGPANLPAESRIQQVGTVADTVKVPLGAGYEHFRHQGENTTVGGENLPVFRWVMRTAIAE
ncbi:DUF5988 family protein [Nonomuraea typhae]|uniref:DUF5988 family protein n=1 Tax=Nonomuraea typhae TaxID=2603600 RepID=UPI0012F9F402|nr:DUF5988 family protein [Nonomuraea typhae]